MMIHAHMALSLSLALAGAVTDVRSGIVKNKHLMTALVAWLMLIACEYFVLHSSSVDLLTLSVNVIFTLIVSVMLYATDIWAPGDCKLYVVMSLIFPLRAYVVRKGNIFPALDFIIYAFAAGYVFLLVTAVKDKAFGKISFAPKFTLKQAVSILANSGTISFLNVLVSILAPEFLRANQMLCLLSSVALILFLQMKAAYAGKIFGLFGLAFFVIHSIAAGTLLHDCASLAVSLVVASVLEFLSSRTRTNSYREISGDEVRPGIILSFTTLWAMRDCADPELPKSTTEDRRSRLSVSQAEAVKTWCRNSRSNVVIVDVMPFAPFIACAVVIQVLRFILLGR